MSLRFNYFSRLERRKEGRLIPSRNHYLRMHLPNFLGLALLSCCFIASNAKNTGDCNFEKNTCHWTNVKGENLFNWTRRSDGTPSVETGPDRDHTTGSGTYLYIETSHPRKEGQVARLISPLIRGPQCMIFWYHMFGTGMGNVTIYANKNGSLHLLWLKGGNRGLIWHKAVISIRETGKYKVEIEGVRGKDFQSDAAIDDVSFYPGVCKEKIALFSKIYAYTDGIHYGLIGQESTPTPGPQTFQYGLHLQQEPYNKNDSFYLLCQAKTGLQIAKTNYTTGRQKFPCEARDFFFGPNSSREGLHPFFVIDRGYNSPLTIELKNESAQYNGSITVMKLFASSIDFSVNLAHNRTVSQSSQVPGFPPILSVDGDPTTCAKTLVQDNPWLEINLDGSRFIYKVYVTKLQNGFHGDHLPNITVTMYDQNVQVRCQTTDRRARNISRFFLCQPPLRAQKVRLEFRGKQKHLTVCEIIINAADSAEQFRGVRAETWHGISNTPQLVKFLKSPKRQDSPDISQPLDLFRDNNGVNTHYAQRLTSFIQPPSDGRYQFNAWCHNQCKVWMKDLNDFSDVTFFEDLDHKKQQQQQLLFTTKGAYYGSWKNIDSCNMYMLEGILISEKTYGIIDVVWNSPNGPYMSYNLQKAFWILPGLQILDAKLLEPKISQRSFVVGQTLTILMTYRLCCHGIYCPSCPKTVRLQLFERTIVVNSSLSTTCQWYNYTTSFRVAVNQPGTYYIKVLESPANKSTRTQHNLTELHIQARVLQSCFYLGQSCSWSMKDVAGITGWITVQNAHNKEHFLEAQTNKTAWLQSPTIRSQSLDRSVGLCLVFDYRNNHRSSELEVLINTHHNNTVLWRLKGMQGHRWNTSKIPWPGVASSQILIRGKTSINSSVAVTNIHFLTMKCSLTPNHAKPGHRCKTNEFTCDNGVCIKSSLRCDDDYACVDKSDESNCACRSSEYRCPDGKCLSVAQLCNGLEECQDGSDEASCAKPCKENQFTCLDGSCVLWSATCDDKQDCQDGSDEPAICSSLKCPLNNINCATKTVQNESSNECHTFRGPCNFDDQDFCELSIRGTKSPKFKTQWQIKKGPTPSSGTGPSADHTKQTPNGSYLYLETSGLNPGNAAELNSAWLKYNSNTCLQFWYHMWGNHVGSLNVYVITNQTRNKIWSRTSDAGPIWRFAQTPIYSNRSSFKFVFEATAGNGSKGDIAIDDVDLITGKCDLPSSCEMKNHFCNWKGDEGWVVKKKEELIDIPERRHQDYGSGNMESPKLFPQNGFKCLRFWYFIKTAALLRLYSVSSNNENSTLLWSSQKITKEWTFNQIPLQSNYEYKLSFEDTNHAFSMGLHDITLSRDTCQKATSIHENYCKQRTTNGDCCVFPFIYQQKCYTQCIFVFLFSSWCSITENYNRDGLKGTCVIGNIALKETPQNCTAIFRQQNDRLHWNPDSSSNVKWSPRQPTGDFFISQDGVNRTRTLDRSIYPSYFELSFNGTSPGASFLIVKNLESFTACIWIKTNDTTNKGTLVRYIYSNITLFGLINHKNIVITLFEKEKQSGISANDGKWHHLCLVWISKRGVYEMYKDGNLVIQGANWHKSTKLSANGTVYIGADGFVGKISGMNIWTVAMSWSDIAQRAVGCGIGGGDIIDWSRFNETAHPMYPPSCLDIGGEGYSIAQNTTNTVTADLFSNAFNGSLDDYTTSFCFHFRYNMIGAAAKSLKIYRSGINEDVNRTGEELAWVALSTANTPLWRFGKVSLTTLQLYKVRVSASLGPGEGSIGLAGYHVKPGYCSSFNEEEIKGCQVNMTSQSNTISSPYFPDSYPNNIECQWWITRPPGYVIRLRFLAFDLEDSPGCHNDYLKVYDGKSAMSNALGKYCGNSFPLLLESSSNSLRIAFKSVNKEYSYSLSGFKIYYTSYRKEYKACNLIENCPPGCTCSSLKGKPQRVIMSCKGLTTPPRKTPANTVAIMLSHNHLSGMDYSGISSSLLYMDVSHNYIMRITPYSFIRLKALTTLRMDFNFIKELRPKVFVGLSSLKILDIGHNLLSTVKAKTLDDVRNLQILSLRSNRISRIETRAFQFLKNLTHLYLQSNNIEELPNGVFDRLKNLKVLYLDNNKLKKVTKDTFRNLISLKVLYLDKNHIQSLDEDAFANLHKLRSLKLDRFVFCCYAVKSVQDLTCISPSSAFSSCDDLMKNKTLQVCIWILGILAFVGNIGVIIWRYMAKERNRVYSFLLTNLAVSDLMMGVYLLTIAIKDLEWRGEYFKHDLQWRFSRVCQLAGALSVVSSEVSVLILTAITADTFSSIVFPFKFKRLKMRSAVFLVSLIWIFGLAIAIVPTLFTHYFYDYNWQAGFYGRSAVCLPLQLSHERFPGWEYSVAIFIGLNFIAFVFILIAYIIMFWKVRSTSRSVRSNQMKTQSAMARKMMFIIMTDFCCWMPVIIIGVLSLLGGFPDPEKLAYVWIAVFVLPVNSSINPVLYTFSTRIWRRRDQGRSFIEPVRHQVTRITLRGLSHANHVKPMDNLPSVTMDDAFSVTNMRLDYIPKGPRSLDDSSRKPSINFVQANVFEEEFSESVSFYRSFCEKSEESMVLLKHFCSGERGHWARELEVMERLRKDGGGQPNIIRHLWYSPVQEASILIDITKHATISEQGFLLCYDLISCTTLHDYLSKPETNLDTQTLLAIATDVINALSYLERCDVRHNHVTAKNILIKEYNTVPSIQAVLGGFGQATLVTSLQESNSNTDIKQYGTLMKHVVARYPNADPENQVKDISIKCEQEPNALTALVVSDMIEEVWDGRGTWDTLL